MSPENRRAQPRRAVDASQAFGYLATDHRRLAVLVVDESAFGLGLIAAHGGDLEPGQEVMFESPMGQSAGRVGRIRHSRLTTNRVARVGLEWTD